VNGIDWAVVALYFCIIAGIGVWAGRKGKTTEDFFLGGRRMPWTTAMLSLLATEASAVTFIGAPGDSFGGNMWYAQMAIGSLVARIIVATVFLTAFYRFRVTTVYEFLKHRFGEATRGTGSAFFIVTRLLASGVRLCVMAKVVNVVVGMPFALCLGLVATIAMAYTFFGGIRAVMWTDVVQFGIFIGGAWLAFGLLLARIDGGWSGMMATANAEGKGRIFDFSFSLTNGTVFWAAVLCGLFQSMAAFGTDQDMTQRMLTCRKPSLAKRGLILTGLIDFPIVFTFLLIGLALYALKAQTGFAEGIDDTDHVFPTFIMTYLPAGLKGLLLAAVFAAAMSSLDSALNALSSSAVTDLYKTYVHPGASDRHYLLVSRLFIALFAFALVAVAWLCKDIGGVLVLAFRIVSYTYGALLGVFLLGLLTKRGNNVTNIIAMLTSVLVVVFLNKIIGGVWHVLIFAGRQLALIVPWFSAGDVPGFFGSAPIVAWHWMIIIGTVWTFGFAAIFPGRRTRDVQPAG
jgi:SSS family solute:Na+ symporter